MTGGLGHPRRLNFDIPLPPEGFTKGPLPNVASGIPTPVEDMKRVVGQFDMNEQRSLIEEKPKKVFGPGNRRWVVVGCTQVTFATTVSWRNCTTGIY